MPEKYIRLHQLIFGIINSIFLFTGPLLSAQQLPIEAPSVKSFIDSVNVKWALKYRNAQPQFYRDHYMRDACIFPPDALPICDQAQIESFYYADGAHKEWQVIRRAQRLSVHFDVLIEEGNMTVLRGGEEIPILEKYITIWKAEAGEWKVYREIWNSNGKIQ